MGKGTITKTVTGCIVLPMLAFCGCLGSVMMLAVGGDVVDYMRSNNWEQAEAVVTNVDIIESRDEDGTTYRPVVEYEFRVDGQNYFGNRPYFGGNILTGDGIGARNFAAQFEVGDDILVYFDPNNPSDSVINRDASGGLWGFLITGGVILAITLVMLFFLIRFFRRWNPSVTDGDKPKGKPKNDSITGFSDQAEDMFVGVLQQSGVPVNSFEELKNLDKDERKAISDSMNWKPEKDKIDDLDDFEF